MGEKEKYKRLIYASPLFALDRDSEAYEVERYKMIDYLYRYMTAGYGDEKVDESDKRDYRNFGYEITVVAGDCIKSFSPEKGDFLHYFVSALTKKRNMVVGTQSLSQRTGGLVHTEHTSRMLMKYNRFISDFVPFQEKYEKLKQFAAKRGMPVPPDLIEDLAEKYQISRPTVQQVIKNGQVPPRDVLIAAVAVQFNCSRRKAEQIVELSKIHVVDEIMDDGENETSIFDTIADDGKTPEEVLLEEECAVSREEVFSRLNDFYNTRQERQKPLLSAVITFKLLGSAYADEWTDLLCSGKYDFLNRECIDFYRREKRIPSQKEIGAFINKSEASISRTVNDFLKHFGEYLQSNPWE